MFPIQFSIQKGQYYLMKIFYLNSNCKAHDSLLQSEYWSFGTFMSFMPHSTRGIWLEKNTPPMFLLSSSNTISKDNLTQFGTFPWKWYKSSDLQTQRHIIDVCLTKVESSLRFDVRRATFLLRKLFLRTQLLLSNEKVHLEIIIPCSITTHYLVKKCDSFSYNKPK